MELSVQQLADKWESSMSVHGEEKSFSVDSMQGKHEEMREDKDFLCSSKEFGLQILSIGETVMLIFIF